MNYAVVGAGFGDEGKGKVVSWLAAQHPTALVSRYSGGHQASHKVMLKDGWEHVFSNFGSGTLQGLPTFWPSNCTVDPIGIINEQAVLLAQGITPSLSIDFRCPITTPYDKRANRELDVHGSCGVGVGKTYEREERHYSLLAGDLAHPYVFRTKLEMVRQFYGGDPIASDFEAACDALLRSPCVRVVQEYTKRWDHVIFEGSQGVMLDEQFGFFPHVTRGRTRLSNLEEFQGMLNVLYVTRAYLTRHGMGPMPNQGLGITFDNPYEHNLSTGFQGQFRTAPLELDLLKYALTRREAVPVASHKLVMTCLDVMHRWVYTINGKLVEHQDEDAYVEGVQNYLNIEVIRSSSPTEEMT